ncbi:hypothetical protein PBRA_007719 [Plasmodiophora brassicae]|uniref:Uncharacterized protein n=1 Tax=Plasmodiophora brassicae TaxID=37360 RepID=A0A0G4IXC8_PLABS|nr:hypothetical protein PBRA_007719 [Plasmodiophora brassicae]
MLRSGIASGTPGRGAGKGQGVSSAHKQGPPKTTYSTEDLHRGLYLLAKQRLLDMKVDLKTVEDLKGLCHPDRVVENICRKATSGDFDEDFNPEEMADYPEDDKEFMKNLSGSGPGYPEEDFMRGQRDKFGMGDEDEDFEDIPVEEQVVDHIRQELGIYDMSSDVQKSIESIVRKYGLNEVTHEKLYDMMDGKGNRLTDAIEETRVKLEKYVDKETADKARMTMENEDGDAGGANFTRNEGEEIMREILMDAAGLEACTDPDIISAVKDMSSKFNIEEMDEDSPQFKKAVAQLRERFRDREGALSDEQVTFKTATHKVYHEILDRAGLLDSDDYEAIDKELMPVVNKMVKDAKGAIDNVPEPAIESAVKMMRQKFAHTAKSPEKGRPYLDDSQAP